MNGKSNSISRQDHHQVFILSNFNHQQPSKIERSLGTVPVTMTENQIQTPDVFSPDTQVVIKQQHKIAGALKDMLEKRPRPADDIGIFLIATNNDTSSFRIIATNFPAV